MNVAKICRIGYHEEKAQSTDSHKAARTGPPWFLGICGGWLFLFRELGSTGNYLGDLGSKLIVFSFGDLVSTVKK